MYIWVILAPFIAILYSFNLATRSDMREIYVEPQAEAIVSKILLQHRAAENYARDLGYTSYYPGEVDFNLLCQKNYLPYGLEGCDPADVSKIQRRQEIHSRIYCLDKTSSAYSNTVSGCPGSPSCCSQSNAYNYVVTYACVPPKWRNIKTGKPNNDLLNALKNTVGFGVNIGYADFEEKTFLRVYDESTNGSVQDKYTMRLVGRETEWIGIPEYVVNDTDGGDESFNRMCVEALKDDEGNIVDPKVCSYCMVYITPI